MAARPSANYSSPVLVRGSRRRLPLTHSKARAFSLLELVIVLMIVSVLSGCAAFCCHGFRSPKKIAVEEAGDIERWMNGIIRRAYLERRHFTLCLSTTPSSVMVLRWHNPESKEYYLSDGRCLMVVRDGKNRYHFFSPYWRTMTPAFTLVIYPSDRRPGSCPVANITVSARGKVRLSDIR